MSNDLTAVSASDLIALYRAGKASPVEATQAVLARIAATRETLNPFVLVDEEAALAAARESERRWRAASPAVSSRASRYRSRIWC